MQIRIQNGNNQMLKKAASNQAKGSWKEGTENIKKEMNIEEINLSGSKYARKKYVKHKANEYFKKKIEDDSKGKSKVKHLNEGTEGNWQPGRRKRYMNEMNRYEASTIFKTRTRMLECKGNYKNKYPDETC